MNKQDLINQFRKIGITEGTALEVHSSLSSFGSIDKKAIKYYNIYNKLLNSR